MSWHGPVSPSPARYGPVQPSIARYDGPVQPSAVRSSPAQPGTSRHGSARRSSAPGRGSLTQRPLPGPGGGPGRARSTPPGQTQPNTPRTNHPPLRPNGPVPTGERPWGLAPRPGNGPGRGTRVRDPPTAPGESQSWEGTQGTAGPGGGRGKEVPRRGSPPARASPRRIPEGKEGREGRGGRGEGSRGRKGSGGARIAFAASPPDTLLYSHPLSPFPGTPHPCRSQRVHPRGWQVGTGQLPTPTLAPRPLPSGAPTARGGVACGGGGGWWWQHPDASAGAKSGRGSGRERPRWGGA